MYNNEHYSCHSSCSSFPKLRIDLLFFFYFFFILNAKIYNNILPITLPTKLLYDTTKTLPGGAICHDYPLAFNINLKKKKKNTSKYTTKYKMLNIGRKLFYKQILKPVSH